MHFAAVAYVGESTLDPLKYYHYITTNTLVVLEAMAAHNVNTLIYSSTCATYGELKKMPITEATPQKHHLQVAAAEKIDQLMSELEARGYDGFNLVQRIKEGFTWFKKKKHKLLYIPEPTPRTICSSLLETDCIYVIVCFLLSVFSRNSLLYTWIVYYDFGYDFLLC
ncbi:putative UDP-arabinose 4-epimerase [Helianthus annuus]|nr:putative UDP-arabinose 4-epimerase [Helianthus annuus]